jgi:hypothetical protein
MDGPQLHSRLQREVRKALLEDLQQDPRPATANTTSHFWRHPERVFIQDEDWYRGRNKPDKTTPRPQRNRSKRHSPPDTVAPASALQRNPLPVKLEQDDVQTSRQSVDRQSKETVPIMFPDYPVYFTPSGTLSATESCGVNIGPEASSSGVANVEANVELHEYRPVSVEDASDTNSLHAKPFKPEDGVGKNVWETAYQPDQEGTHTDQGPHNQKPTNLCWTNDSSMPCTADGAYWSLHGRHHMNAENLPDQSMRGEEQSPLSCRNRTFPELGTQQRCATPDFEDMLQQRKMKVKAGTRADFEDLKSTVFRLQLPEPARKGTRKAGSKLWRWCRERVS